MAKEEKFNGARKKHCECCGKKFIPAWNHPEQKYCQNAECIRKRNAQRKRRNSNHLMRTPAYRQALARRKHAEYERRKERLAVRAVELIEAKEHHGMNISAQELTLLGLLSLVTDITDQNDLRNLHSKCYEIGRNCFSGYRYGSFQAKQE